MFKLLRLRTGNERVPVDREFRVVNTRPSGQGSLSSSYRFRRRPRAMPDSDPPTIHLRRQPHFRTALPQHVMRIA